MGGPTDEHPWREGWLFEPKWDAERSLRSLHGRALRIFFATPGETTRASFVTEAVRHAKPPLEAPADVRENGGGHEREVLITSGNRSDRRDPRDPRLRTRPAVGRPANRRPAPGCGMGAFRRWRPEHHSPGRGSA